MHLYLAFLISKQITVIVGKTKASEKEMKKHGTRYNICRRPCRYLPTNFYVHTHTFLRKWDCHRHDIL